MVYFNIFAFIFILLRFERMRALLLDVNNTVPGLGLSGESVSDRVSYLQRFLSMTPPQGLDSYLTSNSLFAFPEDLEVSVYCRELLHIFGHRYVSYVGCLVSYARPVRICQNCYIQLSDLDEIYSNISDKLAPDNTSCRDSLLRSDRLMLVNVLYNNLKDIWETSHCSKCLKEGSLSKDTLYYTAKLNESLSCFDSQKSNTSELCKECKTTYKNLSDLYSAMERNDTLCIDIEDAMNMTRKLWSKNFNCLVPREETVPVIAVSSFMLFLPIIFYLSSFLHSEQKKRKLIHPKRAKSSNSLMNIQDKYS